MRWEKLTAKPVSGRWLVSATTLYAVPLNIVNIVAWSSVTSTFIQRLCDRQCSVQVSVANACWPRRTGADRCHPARTHLPINHHPLQNHALRQQVERRHELERQLATARQLAAEADAERLAARAAATEAAAARAACLAELGRAREELAAAAAAVDASHGQLAAVLDKAASQEVAGLKAQWARTMGCRGGSTCFREE
jgi:hypothetical protein